MSVTTGPCLSFTQTPVIQGDGGNISGIRALPCWGGHRAHDFMVICMDLDCGLRVTPLFFLIELLLTYNLVLVSGVQHNDLIDV